VSESECVCVHVRKRERESEREREREYHGHGIERLVKVLSHCLGGERFAYARWPVQ
jgi:hypothetical protein